MIKINLVGDLPEVDVKKVTVKIARTISQNLKISAKHYVSLIIVDLTEIQRINKEYRNLDSPTDVISFAYGDGEEVLPDELGDIFICREKVLSQALEYGHSNLREYAFLVIHGILHLLGYDHLIPEDEKEMFQKQDEILEILEIRRK